MLIINQGVCDILTKCYTFVDNELQSYMDNQQICELIAQRK